MGKFDVSVCGDCERPQSAVEVEQPRRSGLNFEWEANFDPKPGISLSRDELGLEFPFAGKISVPFQKPVETVDRVCTNPTCESAIRNMGEDLKNFNNSLNDVRAKGNWQELDDVLMERLNTRVQDMDRTFSNDNFYDQDSRKLDSGRHRFDQQISQQADQLRTHQNSIAGKESALRSTSGVGLRGSSVENMDRLASVLEHLDSIPEQYESALAKSDRQQGSGQGQSTTDRGQEARTSDREALRTELQNKFQRGDLTRSEVETILKGVGDQRGVDSVLGNPQNDGQRGTGNDPSGRSDQSQETRGRTVGARGRGANSAVVWAEPPARGNSGVEGNGAPGQADEDRSLASALASEGPNLDGGVDRTDGARDETSGTTDDRRESDQSKRNHGEGTKENRGDSAENEADESLAEQLATKRKDKDDDSANTGTRNYS